MKKSGQFFPLLIWLCLLPVIVAAVAALRQAGSSEPAAFSMPLEKMVAVQGAGALVAGSFELTSLTPANTALISLPLEPSPADKYSYLRYEVRDFPQNFDLLFYWRLVSNPEKLHFATLYAPRSRALMLRLASRPNWRGQLSEVGFALFPYQRIAPVQTLRSSMQLVSASLHEESIENSLRALFDDWLAFRPWTLRSVNRTGGDQSDFPEPSFTVVIAIWVAIGCLLALGLRQLPIAFFALVTGWVVLDVHWVRNLYLQREATHSAYGDAGWDDLRRQVFDQALFEFGEAFRAQVPVTNERVFIAASSRYISARAVWHLLPLNAFNYMPGFDRSGETLIREDDILVFYGVAPDRAGDVLKLGEVGVAVREIWRQGDGLVLRVTSVP